MGSDAYFGLTEDIRLDLLEVLGRGYVVDHCIASLNKQRKEQKFRVYLTDVVKMIAENTAKMAQGTMPVRRYADIMMEDTYGYKKAEKKKPQTTKEVVNSIRAKWGGEKNE